MLSEAWQPEDAFYFHAKPSTKEDWTPVSCKRQGITCTWGRAVGKALAAQVIFYAYLL